jgi:hypothetical protein
VHIIAVPFKSNWSHQIRPSDGAGNYLDGQYPGTRTMWPISLYGAVVASGVAFVINAQDVEIAGFTIDCGGAYCGVYIGDGSGITGAASSSYNAAGAWIHDNYFVGDGSGTTAAGVVLQGCASDVVIENNMFDKLDGFGVYIGSGSGKTNERPTIRNNHFKNCKSYGVYVYDNNTNIQILIHSNTFQDGSNTMTYAIAFAGDSCIDCLTSDNWFGCTNPMSGAASSWIASNHRNTAGNANTFVDVD